MSGLVQIAREEVTTSTASVTLTGIDTDDVYMLTISNYRSATDNNELQLRVTNNGTAVTHASYDYAAKLLRTDKDATNAHATGNTYVRVSGNSGTQTGETVQGILYLFNFNNSSGYSFLTKEITQINANGTHLGWQGGDVQQQAASRDGVYLYAESGNISQGIFTLYRIT
jgi:hypothetical protein